MSDEPRDDVPMTIGEHLEELRSHVLKAVVWIVVALFVCLAFQSRIFLFILGPHEAMVESIRIENESEDALRVLTAERVGAARAAIKRDVELGKKLDEVERAHRLASEVARPTSKEALAALEERQQTAIARLDVLTRELYAAGEARPPDPARLEKLERELAAAKEQTAALRAQVARDVRPLIDVNAKGPKAELLSVDPTDTFLTHIKLSFVAALFMAAPLIIYELWKFISRALYPHERKWVRLFGPLTYAAFLAGFMFGYFILIPLGLSFLAAYAPVDLVETSYSVKGYISMVITLALVCGVIFELPLFMCFLSLIGIVDAPTLRSWRRYWILAAFVIGGILTPPDPFTQSLMAIPLLGLYELGILLSALVSKPPPPDEVVAQSAAPEPSIQDRYPETPLPETPLADRYPETPLEPPPPDAAPDLVLGPGLEPRPAPEGTIPANGDLDAPPPPTPPAPDIHRREGEPTA